jgi:hypothetical protein
MELNVITSKLLPLTTILPDVPKAIARALALLDANIPTVKVLLFKVIVPEVSVNAPVATVNVGLPDKEILISDLFTVVIADTAVEATVTTAAVPELVSKIAVSAFVGGPNPPAPPVLVAQFVVLALFQVPFPPTQ